ncbi:MAG: hypothetical protein WDK96_03490 [Candidatus Paceibacterota bacterium]|jgi:hypothetical protein
MKKLITLLIALVTIVASSETTFAQSTAKKGGARIVKQGKTISKIAYVTALRTMDTSYFNCDPQLVNDKLFEMMVAEGESVSSFEDCYKLINSATDTSFAWTITEIGNTRVVNAVIDDYDRPNYKGERLLVTPSGHSILSLSCGNLLPDKRKTKSVAKTSAGKGDSTATAKSGTGTGTGTVLGTDGTVKGTCSGCNQTQTVIIGGTGTGGTGVGAQPVYYTEKELAWIRNTGHLPNTGYTAPVIPATGVYQPYYYNYYPQQQSYGYYNNSGSFISTFLGSALGTFVGTSLAGSGNSSNCGSHGYYGPHGGSGNNSGGGGGSTTGGWVYGQN